MIRIAWLADAPTFGPMVRAKAVFEHPEVKGTVLSWRQDFDGVEAVADVVSVTGLHGSNPTREALAQVEADVIVSDWQNWEVARGDGRPWVPIGFAHRSETLWDLDEAPLHPWGANPPEALRDELRGALGLSGPVIATMSPRSQTGIIEGTIWEGLARRPDVTLLRVPEWNGAVYFRAADLVVTSAGWSSSWEARWSGVPYFLVQTNSSDQTLRASGSTAEALRAVEAVEVFEDWEVPEVPDHVPSFVDLLRSMA